MCLCATGSGRVCWQMRRLGRVPAFFGCVPDRASGCHGLAAQRSGHAVLFKPHASSLNPFKPRPSLRSASFWDVPPMSIFIGGTETRREENWCHGSVSRVRAVMVNCSTHSCLTRMSRAWCLKVVAQMCPRLIQPASPERELRGKARVVRRSDTSTKRVHCRDGTFGPRVACLPFKASMSLCATGSARAYWQRQEAAARTSEYGMSGFQGVACHGRHVPSDRPCFVA